MKILIPILAILVLVQCHKAPKSFISKRLTPVWEVDQLKTTESVKYDPVTRRIYVSNINGEPEGKDGDGFISNIELGGKYAEINWLIGLDAPKGLGVYAGKLYVTDITDIVIIDILQTTIQKRIPVEGAQFLNDLDIDSTGQVFFSDSFTNTIYRMHHDTIERWLTSDQLKSCNGVYCGKDKLYVGTSNQILMIGYDNKQISVFRSDTGPVDGLRPFDQDTFIYSDWTGSVYLIGKEDKPELLLNTSVDKINAADIEYIPEKKLLIVPTFHNNKIMAYEVK